MRYCLLICVLFTTTVQARLVGEDVDYSSGATLMKGYVVYDDTFKGKKPAVLVVHAWWGHNEYVRHRADMLAKLGYTALAIDMYGEGKTANNPKDTGEFANAVMKHISVAQTRVKIAMDILKKHKTTDSKSIAAIG